MNNKKIKLGTTGDFVGYKREYHIQRKNKPFEIQNS
jgi:hypothetical protein